MLGLKNEMISSGSLLCVVTTQRNQLVREIAVEKNERQQVRLELRSEPAQRGP